MVAQRAAAGGGLGPLVVQRKADKAPGDAGAGGSDRGRSPRSDPQFLRLTGDVRAKQKRMAAHAPARSEAANAQGAAKPGSFDKAGFIRAVNEAIAAQAPKNLDEADKFADSGKADAVKGALRVEAGRGRTQRCDRYEGAVQPRRR